MYKVLSVVFAECGYWDSANGKTKQKILGGIIKEKFENFDFESYNQIFTPEIESILLALRFSKRQKTRDYF